ncbi:hypothetical protein M422DRAFT_244860 [Sphaerobolus stellatus SS14]|nr:hypothetical protein M422DRAFT_244860 [Sphaerobolus stellatus SS14]
MIHEVYWSTRYHKSHQQLHRYATERQIRRYHPDVHEVYSRTLRAREDVVVGNAGQWNVWSLEFGREGLLTPEEKNRLGGNYGRTACTRHDSHRRIDSRWGSDFRINAAFLNVLSSAIFASHRLSQEHLSFLATPLIHIVMISTINQVVSKLMRTRTSKFEALATSDSLPGAQMLDPEDMAW